MPPVWVKSHHSFLHGASSPEELVDRAAELGWRSMALTDRHGVYGIVRAHVRARQVGLRLIAGVELEVREAGSPSTRVLLYPEDRQGYGTMCRLISMGHARAPKGEAWVTPAELREHSVGLLAGCVEPGLLEVLAEPMKDRLYAVVVRHREDSDAARMQKMRATARRVGVPWLCTTEVLYHDRCRRPLQDLMTCIGLGTHISEAGRKLRCNDEHALLSPADLRALHRDDEVGLVRAAELLERSQFSLDDLRYRYPAEALPRDQTAQSWLTHLTEQGALRRYGGCIPSDVRAQLERELSVIEDLEYGGYFLTMHDIVDYCRSQGILCQGRGSAANSAVCFCLGITAVDPVRMGLLFERFLSRERAEPPDIDLDIEHERREEVIQHVYSKYGRRRAAMVANTIRYRTKSALREVGKALGVDRTDIDSVARLCSAWGGTLDDTIFQQAGLDPDRPLHRHWQHWTNEMLDAPRHLSIHPGGFLLGHLPVDELVPIEPATMEDRTVIQWDKYDVEALGLFKVDLLGLGTLTCIRKSLALVREHQLHPNPDLDMATVPQEDPATYAMCSAADTVGVFQIESRAQMAMLPRLRPRTFYDLVIQVAIVRPGPIQGDMVHPYLRRRIGKEKVEYPHADVEPILAKTLGVPIFQEQVMKVAVVAGGYTPGEADQLRRDMAAWRSAGKIEKHYERLTKGMIERGVEPEFAERLFGQIRGFGEYGFPESHAASFALLAYVTAWLRCHMPEAFLCALLNSQPMGFYSAATIVEDAKRHGLEVRPVCAEASAWDATLEAKDRRHAIRMGLRSVRGLGERERRAIETAERPFGDLETFARRTALSERALSALAEAGAFECWSLSRRDALWQAKALGGVARSLAGTAARTQMSFGTLAADDAVLWDYRASQHSTRGHPMARHREQLKERRIPTAEELAHLRDGARLDYVGLVICRQRPGTASGVVFMTLEDETGFVNLVVWSQLFEEHRIVAKTSPFLGVTGRVQKADGVTHLIAERLWRFQGPQDLRSQSRDFH